MTAEEIKAIFEPVISEVIALVNDQVDAIRAKGSTVSGILLVRADVFARAELLAGRIPTYGSSLTMIRWAVSGSRIIYTKSLSGTSTSLHHQYTQRSLLTKLQRRHNRPLKCFSQGMRGPQS